MAKTGKHAKSVKGKTSPKAKKVKARPAKRLGSAKAPFLLPTDTPISLAHFVSRQDYTQAETAAPRRPVERRPSPELKGAPEGFEISLLASPKALAKFLATYVQPRIPDVADQIGFPLMGKNFDASVVLRTGTPALDLPYELFDKRPPLRFTLPFVEGKLTLPGETIDFSGTSLVAYVPFEDAFFEIRWQTPGQAVLVLRLAKTPLSIAYRLEGAPHGKLLDPMIETSKNVVNAILAGLSLDQQVLGTFEVPPEAVPILNMIPDAVPSHVHLNYQAGKTDGATMDAIAVNITCNAKHFVKPKEPELKTPEELGVRVSSGLVMGGVAKPVLMTVLKQLQAALPDNAVEMPDKNKGIRIRDAGKRYDAKDKFWIEIDSLDDLATRPLFADNPSLKAILDSARKNAIAKSVKLAVSFEVALSGSQVTLDINLRIRFSAPVAGQFTLLVHLRTDYALEFVTVDGEQAIRARPLTLLPEWKIQYSAKWWEHALQALILALASALSTIVLMIVLDLVVLWLLACVATGSILFKDNIKKALAGLSMAVDAIGDYPKFSAALDVLQKNPANLSGFVVKANELIDKLNKDATLDKKIDHISLATLTFDYKLPAAAAIAPLKRLLFNETTELFTGFAPPAPARRPGPRPLRFVEIYEFAHTEGELRYYSPEPEPLKPNRGGFVNKGPAFFASLEPQPGFIPFHLYSGRPYQTREDGYFTWPSCAYSGAVETILQRYKNRFITMRFERTLFYLPSQARAYAAPLGLYGGQNGGLALRFTPVSGWQRYEHYDDPASKEPLPKLLAYPFDAGVKAAR